MQNRNPRSLSRHCNNSYPSLRSLFLRSHRHTVDGLTPRARPTSRRVFGFSFPDALRAASNAVGWTAGFRPRPFASTSNPSGPNLLNRLRHNRTVTSVVPSSLATSLARDPFASISTIRLRRTTLTDAVRLFDHRRRTARSCSLKWSGDSGRRVILIFENTSARWFSIICMSACNATYGAKICNFLKLPRRPNSRETRKQPKSAMTESPRCPHRLNLATKVSSGSYSRMLQTGAEIGEASAVADMQGHELKSRQLDSPRCGTAPLGTCAFRGSRRGPTSMLLASHGRISSGQGDRQDNSATNPDF
jgi:hypothetical protein